MFALECSCFEQINHTITSIQIPLGDEWKKATDTKKTYFPLTFFHSIFLSHSIDAVRRLQVNELWVFFIGVPIEVSRLNCKHRHINALTRTMITIQMIFYRTQYMCICINDLQWTVCICFFKSSCFCANCFFLAICLLSV